MDRATAAIPDIGTAPTPLACPSRCRPSYDPRGRMTAVYARPKQRA